MLNEQATISLIIKAQQGDLLARDELIEQNLNLVRSIIYRFTNRGYEWDDLFQIGCMGLVKAITRFDLNFKVKFSTYAVPMIIGEIRRFLRDDNPMKVSRTLKELAYRVLKTQERIQGDLGREPTINEIARELSLATHEVLSALEVLQPTCSLYEQTYHDNGDSITILDHIKTDTGGIDNCYFEKLDLLEIIAQLPKKEQTVVELRFYQDKTQAEIAKKFGLSQVQISRIEKNALKLIKRLLETS